ncbi:MAG: carbohydrate ABC transporter permease [Spirochaetia bacterium]|jgi:ABC-type glycerol-3-phosphate transport system permease component
MRTTESLPRLRPSSARHPFIHLALLVLLFLALVPLGLMILVSLKSPPQYLLNPVGLTVPLHVENYLKAALFLAPSFLWTFLVIVCGISLNLVTSSLAAYAFARHRFPGGSALFFSITGLMFIPSILVLFPLYLWNVHLGLRDVWGLIVSYWILGQCFSVFFLQNAFRSLPEEMFEAARMDGAGHMRMWARIVLPLSRSMITTLAIMMLLWIYTNDYVWQYIMAGSAQRTMVPVVLRGLSQTGSGGSDLDRGLESAGYVVASAPMLLAFLFASKAFVRGLMSGSTKG